MRTAVGNLRFLHRSVTLTQEEIQQITSVIPRLCRSNNLKKAINLISTAVSAADLPIDSLPIQTLIHRLSLESDLRLSLYFLNSLNQNPNFAKSLVAKMFVSSFFEKRCPEKALRIFDCVSAMDSADPELHETVIDGLCKSGMVKESVEVVTAMVDRSMVVGNEVWVAVYKALLREARVHEALALNAALGGCTQGIDGSAIDSPMVKDCLGRIIDNWEA